MTAAHLEVVRESVEEAQQIAIEQRGFANRYNDGSASWKKYVSRANYAEQGAARLSEVAAMIRAQIEGTDDDQNDA
jgi:hypothetical protein